MSENLKKTPLHGNHLKLNARMVDFGGWHMPVQYTSIIEEHVATRTHVGLFDVSHMGEIEITGPDALPFIQKMVTQDVSKAKDGEQVQYSLMCTLNGGVVDDILIYKFSPTHLFLCVNASNTDKDFEWLCQHKANAQVDIQNRSSEYVQIAIQGPKAQTLLQEMTSVPLPSIKYYRFTKGKVSAIDMIISRTGYTGEDGFELYLPSPKGPQIWEELLDRGKKYHIHPCGLGARDTLRIEMRYPLYGHELSSTISPLEADLEWVVKWNKEDFFGKDVLVQQKEKGIPRKCVGFELLDPGIARQGYTVYTIQNELIGEVTSGTLSPTLKKSIGIGFVKPSYAQIGQELAIEIRGKKVKAKVVPTPFVKKS